MKQFFALSVALSASLLSGGCQSHLNSVAYFDPPRDVERQQFGNLTTSSDQASYSYDAAQPFTMRLTNNTIKHWRAGPTTVVSVWRGGLINQPGALFIATMAPPLNNHASQAAYLEIPSSVANTYSGSVLTITVTAKQAANGSTDSFAVNYTTADGDSTGWVKFTPAGRYEDYSVSFQKPPSVSASPDYVGIWADTEATGRSLIVAEVTVSSEAIGTQEARLIVANMEPALGGQISASNQGNRLTYDLAQGGTTGPLGFESGSIVAIDESRIPPLQGVSDYGLSLPGANALERADIVMPDTPLGSTRSASEGLRPDLQRSAADLAPLIFGDQSQATSPEATDAARGRLGYLDSLGNFIPMSQAEQELLAVGQGRPESAQPGADMQAPADRLSENLELQELEGVKLTELPDGLGSANLRPTAGETGLEGLGLEGLGPEDINLGNPNAVPNQGQGLESLGSEDINFGDLNAVPNQGRSNLSPDLGSLDDILALGSTGGANPPGPTQSDPAQRASDQDDPNLAGRDLPTANGAPAQGLTEADLMLMIGPMPTDDQSGSVEGKSSRSSSMPSLTSDSTTLADSATGTAMDPEPASLDDALRNLSPDDLTQLLKSLKREDNVKVPIVEALPQNWAWGAHLASYPDPGLAEIGWSVLERTYEGLSYFEPHIQRVLLYDGNWIMYRLFAGPLDSRATAEAFCASVAQDWEYCVPRAPGK